MDNTQRLFRRHVKKLKDEHLAKRVQGYMEMLPDVLQEMIPEISTLRDGDWPTVQQHIKDHPDFNNYFYKCPDDVPWTEYDWDEDGDTTRETRIPYDVLDTGEAETVFKNHANSLQQEQKRLEWRKQFKQLLEDTGYVTPGKLLSEVRVLFMGRECFEALSEEDCQQIYDRHQKDLVEKAKHNFQELLLEHADLFYHFKSIAPTGTITQDDIKEITDSLKEDFRYKALDRLDQDRKLMLFQHLGFVHCPIREHCPAFPNCMDALIERILGTKAHRPSSWNHSSQWLLNSDNNQLNLVILGVGGLAEELSNEIRAQCEDDEYEIDCHLYSLEYRIIDGDVSLPQNSFQSTDFLPHGCFCVYSNSESFEYIRESLEKTLLSNLEQDDRLPFQGLPIVILFVADSLVEEKEILRLREEGQSLADSLQCPFIDVSMEEDDHQRFNANLVANALRQLVQSIRHRAGFVTIYQSVVECTEPDIRIIMCMFCGDPYSVENVLGPLLSHQCCFLSGDRSIILETFLGTSKRKVEVIISSFHGANAFREELVHGFILVYSTKRKASLATLNAFSMNIPNLPIQILAVTDTGGANAFFSSDLSHHLITEGNATADRLQAHFMTSTSSFQQKTAFYTPFFKEVWEKKPEIEQAFHMEEPILLPGENIHPLPPPRHESYLIKIGSNDGSCLEMFERLTVGVDEGGGSESDDSDTYSPIDIYSHENDEGSTNKNNERDNKTASKLHQGWVDDSVFLQQAEHEDGVWMNSYSQHAFTTGRRHISKSRYKGTSHTLKQPGKLNMKDYSLVTDAIARMNLSVKEPLRVSKVKSAFGHAPLATPENVDLGSEYAQVKDAVPNLYSSYDGEYAYSSVQDAVGNTNTSKLKLRQRREKGRQMLSDSDSEWSSLERKQKTSNSETYSKMNRKPATHKRVRKKRTAIPVATPRVPLFTIPSLSTNGPAPATLAGPVPTLPSVPPMDFGSINYHLKPIDNCPDNAEKAKLKIESFGLTHDDESSLDVSSPRDVNSPLFGVVSKTKDGDKTLRRKEKQKAKEEEKLEKRRQKEEKIKKIAEEREKKKQKSKATGNKTVQGAGSVSHQVTLEEFAQSENKVVPLILEKCVQFVEDEGLDSEGIYRVPGNRAHVELLFQKFEEDHNLDVSSLDIPVNAVATALKDFFSKRLPPLFTEDLMVELEDISVKGDRSCRLLALRSLLKKLPTVNFEVLKFVFHHFVRVSENCKLNSMDSKNLAICWWPTLLPIEFSDMGRFEQMRPHLEDIVQTMIDQYPFLFCGKEAFVMV
uniref:Rho-GAP domain-containing protein n=1 Tax=Clastoptera arizonana TaxID=38151 RepID=A0A1B6CUS5_9HEMI